MALVVTIYAVLFAITAFAPLRWSMVAYATLSNVDFPGNVAGVGMLNAAKGIVLPLYLLWRLRGYSGHRSVTVAPIAWILLTIYAAVSGFWSFYPVEAFKLVGHMAGLLIICFVFMRAAKGGFLTPGLLVPITIGALAIAVLGRVFEPGWGDEPSRFSSFTGGQAFAAFLVALYCIALCSKTPRLAVRIPITILLLAALVLDGSRIWFFGAAVAALTALLISEARAWLKICLIGLLMVVVAVATGGSHMIITLLGEDAASNRIAAAITAFYEGDFQSSGLGTLRFRRELTTRVVNRLEASSALELLIGHGTCNGATIPGPRNPKMDPNRFFHNEWLHVTYDWGVLGLILWLSFFGSIAMFAYRTARNDSAGYAKPLFIYLPAFLIALTGENFIASAGNSVSTGFLLLIALASVAYRHRYDELSRARAPEVRRSTRMELALNAHNRAARAPDQTPCALRGSSAP